MYASYLDAAAGLNDEEFREFILALQDYALDGIEHESESRMVNGLLAMAQANLEASGLRWKKNAKNGDYGILGGRPRKGETAEEYRARKEAQRQSLNLTKTQNKPNGFQSETLNVNVDVNADENLNVKGNVNENGNGNWNVKGNVDEDADGNEERRISKKTNTINTTNSIFNNIDSCSLKPSSGETPHQENNLQGLQVEYHSKEDDLEDDTNDDLNLPTDPEEDERFCNVVRIEDIKECEPVGEDCDISDLPPIIDEGWTPPPPELQHNEVRLEDPQRQGGRENSFPFTKEQAKHLMVAELLYARYNKDKILGGDDELCDEAADIINEDINVVRRCFHSIFRNIKGKVEPALDKVYELISNKSPRDESEYGRILKDLWKFYIFDRAYWDKQAGRGIDTFNPYRD